MEVTTAVVENVSETTVKAKKKKATKPKGKVVSPKKKEEKRSPGRPRKYDHEMMLEILNKHKGTPGGLKKAHLEIARRKGHAAIAYGTVAIFASENKIPFGAGKPKQKKVKAKPKLVVKKVLAAA